MLQPRNWRPTWNAFTLEFELALAQGPAGEILISDERAILVVQ